MIPGYHPKLTYLLIGLCVLVGLYTDFGGRFETLRPFLITNYVNAGLPEVSNGQIWRIFSPMLVHFGILHIGLNMMWMWQLGTLIEYRRGKIVLLLLVLISAGLSNIGEFMVSGPLFGGMSGVIFALLGYLFMQGRFNPFFGIQLNPKLVTMVMIWFVVCWSGVLETFGIHIANIAHTAGLVSGALWGFIAAKSGSQRI